VIAIVPPLPEMTWKSPAEQVPTILIPSAALGERAFERSGGGVAGRDAAAAMGREREGLTAVPQVLAMMNDKLEWTQQVGEAFLAQPNDVSNAIQQLRAKAASNGNLKSSKQLKVSSVAASAPPATTGPAATGRRPGDAAATAVG
jgi:hypothetical protein